MSVVDQLRLFLLRVDELNDLGLLRAWKSELKISGEIGQPVKFESFEPDEELLRSFLLAFRQFFLKSEPVYINRIYKLSMEHLRSDFLRERLQQSREAWKDAMRGGGLRLELNGDQVTPERAMHLWINGYYFHNDAEKRELINTYEPIGRALTRQQFLGLIADATGQLFFAARVIHEALNAGVIEVP